MGRSNKLVLSGLGLFLVIWPSPLTRAIAFNFFVTGVPFVLRSCMGAWTWMGEALKVPPPSCVMLPWRWGSVCFSAPRQDCSKWAPQEESSACAPVVWSSEYTFDFYSTFYSILFLFFGTTGVWVSEWAGGFTCIWKQKLCFKCMFLSVLLNYYFLFLQKKLLLLSMLLCCHS